MRTKHKLCAVHKLHQGTCKNIEKTWKNAKALNIILRNCWNVWYQFSFAL